MTEQEPLKVYELAKELGIHSTELVDRLKNLEIEVKNHMSELTDAEAARARNALKPTSTSTAKKTAAKPKTTATKTVARRAAAATSEAATPEAPKPAAKTATKKRSTAAPAPKKEESAAAKQAAADATSSTVIRRRVLADGATQTVTSTISTSTENTPAIAAAPSTPAPTPELIQNLDPPIIAEPEATVVAEAAIIEKAPAEIIAPKPEVVVAAPPIGSSVETVTTQVKTASGLKKTSIIRRTETTAPGEQRKSLLRVVDMPKITQPGRAPTKSTASITGPQQPPTLGKPGADRFKMVRIDKENLDRMAEEEAKKRGPRVAEHTVKPEDVKFNDYRKKEMIFVPKKKKPPVGREVKKTEITVAAAHKRVVEMGDAITVSDLAKQMQVKANDVIKKLMQMGQMATMNQALDLDTATLVAQEFNYEVKNIAFKETEVLNNEEDSTETLVHRPPVVTIMGHVDHGKTTLLDAIREANVAAGEAGGITQHIGAYTISKEGKLITFIDTPGHEAFTMMRARGANATDIVILVVAADDGVMPQTREALAHAKAAGVPIIVAVNKMDKPGANPERVKQALAELDLLAEDWGGETIFVPVSALAKTGLDKLLESILLVAEVQDLKANPNVPARGVVLESRLEKGRGPMASMLVQRGTLHVGDFITSGIVYGRVKAMVDHLGAAVKEVGPGMAAEILGLNDVPNAGDRFDAVETEDDAKTLTQHRIEALRVKNQKTSKATLEDLFAKIQAGDTKELRVVLKADVYGSVEAVRDSLLKLSTDKVKVKVIHTAAGGITESDIQLANASNAIIIGFNVRPETKARALAEQEKIEIKTYNIIYELIDDIKRAMAGLLDKKKVETYLGRAEVRQTFSVPKVGTIAGTSVIDGKILRSANIRLLRDSRVIYDGKLGSLKRFKDDAREVAQGYECGIGIDGYNDVKVGDIIEAYQVDMIEQQL